MGALTYTWRAEDGDHALRFVQVPGTNGDPYLFGAEPHRRSIEIRDFHIGSDITRDFQDGCIGFRLVLAPSEP